MKSEYADECSGSRIEASKEMVKQRKVGCDIQYQMWDRVCLCVRVCLRHNIAAKENDG